MRFVIIPGKTPTYLSILKRKKRFKKFKKFNLISKGGGPLKIFLNK